MPTPNCPKCYSEKVKAVTIWSVVIVHHDVKEPPLPMFACQEPTCLHKGPREHAA